MGYKLAGYEVVGNVEIDPRVMKLYQDNLHPKHPFLMDVRNFLEIPDSSLPQELFTLDVLDGSPPCSTFSLLGEREDAWGKEKVFREGQAKQRLDDLFFFFIKIADKLKPKVVVAENVAGILKGNSKGYVNEIIKEFDAAGYAVQVFLLDAARMGVPQMRQRAFFIARRKDLGLPKVVLDFNEKPILFGEVRTPEGLDLPPNGKLIRQLKYMRPTDKYVKDIVKRLYGAETNFSTTINHDHYVARTVTAGGSSVRGYDKKMCTDGDFVNMQTFPQDYDFQGQQVRYICGMSVPPVMMAQVASAINDQMFR